MKTKLKITADWSELKDKLRKNNPELTNDDLEFTPGKEDELVERIEKKLGLTKEKVVEMIENLQAVESEEESAEKY